MYSSWRYWEEDRNHQGITTPAPGEHWRGHIELRMAAMIRLGALPADARVAARSKVLEIGCSEGALVDHLAQLGYDSLGCEVNPEIVRAGRQYYGDRILCADALSHDFGAQRFRTILSFHTFEHICDVAQLTEKCRSLLAPGGHLLVEVPRGADDLDNPDHVHFFTKASTKRLFERFFADVVIEEQEFPARGTVEGAYFVCGTRGA